MQHRWVARLHVTQYQNYVSITSLFIMTPKTVQSDDIQGFTAHATGWYTSIPPYPFDGYVENRDLLHDPCAMPVQNRCKYAHSRTKLRISKSTKKRPKDEPRPTHNPSFSERIHHASCFICFICFCFCFVLDVGCTQYHCRQGSSLQPLE